MLRRKSMHGSRRRWEIHNTTVVQLRTKRTMCKNIYMKPRGNNTDAMPLSESSGRFLAGSEPSRRSRRSTRSNAVDGEELMVPKVPSLPPEPSARQVAEHELTGHAVYRSW